MSAASKTGVVGILIGLMVTILIGVIVIQALVSSQNTSAWSADAKAAWTSLQSNIWVAITLIVIIPIIVGAVAILGYLRFGGG